MNDRILILGAGGFVGTHLVRTLAERGEKVIAVSRQPINLHYANVEIVIGEPDEPEHFLPLLARSRAVVHTASRSTPGSSIGQAMMELQQNLRPTLALLEALQRHPQTNLLYLSSGGTLYAPARDELASEASIPRPLSYHGAGKIAAEHFIGACCSQHGHSATILRPSNIYGPGQRERAGFGIIPTALGKISRAETLHVWGDGSTIRDYLYIADFVKLCVAILVQPMPKGMRVLNAASGLGVSLNELFSLMESITGLPLLRSYDNSRVVDASRVVMDASLARQQCQWSASTSLRHGIENTWAWFNTIQP